MTMYEQWIQQVRQKMAGYRKPAPEVSWEKLDQALAAGQAHRTRILGIKRMAAAVVLLLVGGAGYWSFVHEDDVQFPKTAPIAVNLPQTVDTYHDGAHDMSRQKNQTVVPVKLKTLAKKFDVTGTPASESEIAIPVSIQNNDTINAASAEEEERFQVVEGEIWSSEANRPVVSSGVFHQQKIPESRLTANVYMSGIGASSQSISGGQFFPIEAIKDTIQTMCVDQHIDYHQPVRLGFSLRYRFDDRWSVESGLSYTRLSSDITTMTDGVSTVTEQRLNYIGIPLNIGYNLWNSRYFGLYVTTGGMIEKQLDASPWQFSFSGAAGAEYKLTNRFSLYAEPGLSYYFSDGSDTPTIYRDQPLNFILTFGLRFNLNK